SPTMIFYFSCYCSVHLRYLPSFPTRRSSDLVDFMTTDFHAAVRYGNGNWPDLQAEKMLDDWVFPVASPELFAKLGPIETLGDLRSEEHTSELQSRENLVCRLLLEKKK